MYPRYSGAPYFSWMFAMEPLILKTAPWKPFFSYNQTSPAAGPAPRGERGVAISLGTKKQLASKPLAVGEVSDCANLVLVFFSNRIDVGGEIFCG